jgi:hypothetical protein
MLVGTGFALAIMFLMLLLPSPSFSNGLENALGFLTTRNDNTSEFAVGKDGQNKGDQPRGQQKQKNGNEGPRQKSGNQGDGEGGQGGKSNREKSGSDSSGNQKSNDQQSSNNQQQSKTNQNRNQSRSDKSSQTSEQSNNQNRSQNSKNERDANNESANADKNSDSKNQSAQQRTSTPNERDKAQNRDKQKGDENDPSKAANGDQRQEDQAKLNQPAQNQAKQNQAKQNQADNRNQQGRNQGQGQRQNQPARQNPSSQPSGVGKFLATAIRFLVYGVGIVLLIVVLWMFRDELAKLWNELFGKKSEEKTESGKRSEPKIRSKTLPRFDQFKEPFASGLVADWPVSQVIDYTFAALEAWARDHQIPRELDQTPHEFARTLTPFDIEIGGEAQHLADLLGTSLFSGGAVPQSDALKLKRIWKLMIAKPPVSGVQQLVSQS